MVNGLTLTGHASQIRLLNQTHFLEMSLVHETSLIDIIIVENTISRHMAVGHEIDIMVLLTSRFCTSWGCTR